MSRDRTVHLAILITVNNNVIVEAAQIGLLIDNASLRNLIDLKKKKSLNEYAKNM